MALLDHLNLKKCARYHLAVGRVTTRTNCSFKESSRLKKAKIWRARLIFVLMYQYLTNKQGIAMLKKSIAV